MALPDSGVQPGDLLADRYRMVARIGRGGMGDVWRADDNVLQTAVALKLMHVVSADARSRLLNEVRLARQITHPAVCRVFDIGEADGRVFFSMELVDGEDLAALLRRVGRLPAERVAEMGRQLCEGLAAAHAQGVLHRDLKPANILVDVHGRVVITDFGIAALRTDALRHTMIGTPGYMAPEQMTQGAPLTERSDLYALGLVLYELLVGDHPREFSTLSGKAATPSALVPDVSDSLERAILKAIATDPRDRHQSARAMAEALTTVEPIEGSGATRRSWLAAAAVLAVALIAVLVYVLVPRATPSLDAQDVIVLADFANTTGEPVFDGAMKVALVVALEQSPFLKVFGDERVRETLQLMQRPPDVPVTRAVAREIAVREHLKALIAGSIAALGTNYVVALEAVNAESGDVIAREQVEAAGKEAVLGALGQAARRLREKLGESLTSVQRFDVPLPRATTASLEALHAYSLAIEDGRLALSRESIPQLKRAIEIDPDFAMAQAMLSGVYANIGETAQAPAFSRRAFELRDRVSERERFVISWRYYRDAEQSWTKGLELARTWAATYPRDTAAFNSLGLALLTLGDWAQSEAPLRTAMTLEPKSVAPPQNLAVTLIALDRSDEAKAVLADARLRQRYFIAQGYWSYLVAFLEHDDAAMARHLSETVGKPNASWAGDWEARVDAWSGRMALAHAKFSAGAQTLRGDRLNELAATFYVEDAEAHALVGQCVPARREVADAMALSRDNFTLERASRALVLCHAGAEVEAIVSELTRRYPDATLTAGVAVPVINALMALERGDPARARELLEPVRQYEAAPTAEYWPATIRGRALLMLNDGEGAAAAFQSILDHRGYWPDAMLYPLAHVGRARAALLQRDTALAKRHYESFFELWKDADADLAPLVEARQEYAARR